MSRWTQSSLLPRVSLGQAGSKRAPNSCPVAAWISSRLPSSGHPQDPGLSRRLKGCRWHRQGLWFFGRAWSSLQLTSSGSTSTASLSSRAGVSHQAYPALSSGVPATPAVCCPGLIRSTSLPDACPSARPAMPGTVGSTGPTQAARGQTFYTAATTQASRQEP